MTAQPAAVVDPDAIDTADVAAPEPVAVTPAPPKSGPKSAPPARPAGAPPAREWQWHLIELLAKLENHRLQLVGTRLGPDADYVLDKCEAMAQLAEDLAAATTFHESHTNARMDAVARAGAVFGAANDARRPGGRSLFKSMFSAFTADDPSHAPAVRAVVESAVDAVGTYFSLFTSHYPSSLAARGWVDAASAFLADFKSTAKELTEN